MSENITGDLTVSACTLEEGLADAYAKIRAFLEHDYTLDLRVRCSPGPMLFDGTVVTWTLDIGWSLST